MQKDDFYLKGFSITLSILSALLLSFVQIFVLNLTTEIVSLYFFLFNLVHLSIASLFVSELTLIKMTGHRLFGNENRKIQNSIINRLTFSAFSVILFSTQVILFESGGDYTQWLTNTLLFAIFVSGGIVYTMLQGINAFFKKKKEEKPKESIRLYGICCIPIFESNMTKLSNALFALSKIEEELSQEEIVQINEQTGEMQTLFALYKKLSIEAKKEVEEDLLYTLEGVTQKVEGALFTKDEKYIRLIKRKTKRMNTKTV